MDKDTGKGIEKPVKPENKPLKGKRALFVQEYLVDLNGTQAAIRAGYSKQAACEQASRMLGIANVKAAIDAGLAKRAERTAITQDRVLQELAKIGFSDLRKMLTESGQIKLPDQWDDDTAGAIASLEVVTGSDGESVERIHKIKTWDKAAALDKLGKHLGMFASRHEVGGPGGGPIQTEDVTGYDLARRIALVLGSK